MEIRYFPTSETDIKQVWALHLQDWMIAQLQLNPDYVSWGPYEDGMMKDGDWWDSRCVFETWKDFGPWQLDDLNEVVNFYFYVARDSVNCESCDGTGYNPQTKQLSDDWYDFFVKDSGRKWRYQLEQEEVDALWAKGRLHSDFSEKPTPAQVNSWARKGFGHDSINRWICVKARAEKLGVYGNCTKCGGEGIQYLTTFGRLGLVLWILHPGKGVSRGVDVKRIKKEELSTAYKFLKVAAERNAERFSKIEREAVK